MKLGTIALGTLLFMGSIGLSEGQTIKDTIGCGYKRQNLFDQLVGQINSEPTKSANTERSEEIPAAERGKVMLTREEQIQRELEEYEGMTTEEIREHEKEKIEEYKDFVDALAKPL